MKQNLPYNPSSDIDSAILITDIFNIGELQRMQDLFSDATGVASLITQPDGTPVTRPSNFCRLCESIIRKTEIGLSNCLKSDSALGCYNSLGPIMQPCLSVGLWDTGTSISVDGTHIFNWLIGQVRNEQLDEKQMLEYADKIGADKGAFVAALAEVPVMSVKQFKKVSEMLFEFANQLSEKAYKNLQLKKEIAKHESASVFLKKSEDRFRHISETISDISYACFADKNNNYSIEWITGAVLQITGYSLDEIMEKRCWGFIVVAEDRHLFNLHVSGLRPGSASTCELRLRHKSGSVVWVTSYAQCSVDEGDYGTSRLYGALVNSTERKKTEDALRQSEEMFRNVFEHSVIGKSMTTINGKLRTNNAFCQMLGYSQNELENLVWKEITHPDDIKYSESILASVLSGEKPSARWEKRYIHKNGEIVWVDINTALQQDKNGNPSYFITSIIDISDRKKAEATLKQSEEKYRGLVSDMQVGVLIHGSEAELIMSNSKALELIGINQEQLAGKTSYPAGWNVIREDGSPYPGLVYPVKQAIENRTSVPDVVMGIFRPASADRVWLLVNAHPQLNADGTVHQVVSTFIDITMRKQAEEALKKERMLFRTLIDNIPDSIYSKDLDFRKTLANLTEIRYMGANSEADILGKSDADFYPADIAGKFLADDKLVMKTGIPVLNREEFIFDENGQKKWLLTSKIPLRDENNQVIGLLGIGRDNTERKHAVDALRESEEKYRMIAENTSDGIVLFDAYGKLVYASPAYLTQLGYTEEQELARTPGELNLLLHPDDQDVIFARMIDAIGRKESGLIYTFRIKHSDGHYVWREDSARFKYDGDGNYLGTYIVCRDITERKRSELINKIQYRITTSVLEANDLSELMGIVQQELNTIIDASNFYVALYDEKSGMFSAPYVSNQKDKNYQWPASKSITGLVIRKNKALLLSRKDIEQIYQSGEAELNGDLSSCWLGVPLRSGNKTTGVFVVQSFTNENAYTEKDLAILDFISHQISIAIERKKDQQQINLFGKSIEQSPAGIVITDVNGKIEYVNPRFTEITGYSKEEALQKNPNILKSGIQTDEVYKELWSTITAGGQWFGELQNKKKNGEIYWESESISPIINTDGSITHFVAVKEDFTEKKRMESDLIMAKERAEESDRLKSAFLANMSHEIRTPMNGILGFAELLKMPGLSGEQQQEFIQIIKKSGDRMLNIINDIVDISKIEAGQVELFISETNINEQTDFIYNFFKPAAEEKGIHIICTNGLPNDESFVKTDREKVYAILTNLVRNAIKFIEKGSIEFGYYPTIEKNATPMLLFYVKDTGIGIPLQRQVAIFDRFVQADISDTKAFQGAGLGLSISKAYVEMLGGEISVESEEGKGTVFYFSIPYLPVNGEKDLVEIETPSLKVANQDKNLKILIAEDDEISELLISLVVKNVSREILKVVSGGDAVDACRNHPDIDLVLMDIKMSEMDGYEATRQIRRFNTNVVIIAQTAFGLSGDREKALEAGCNDYISKPLSLSLLKELIQKHF